MMNTTEKTLPGKSPTYIYALYIYLYNNYKLTLMIKGYQKFIALYKYTFAYGSMYICMFTYKFYF